MMINKQYVLRHKRGKIKGQRVVKEIKVQDMESGAYHNNETKTAHNHRPIRAAAALFASCHF